MRPGTRSFVDAGRVDGRDWIGRDGEGEVEAGIRKYAAGWREGELWCFPVRAWATAEALP